MAKTISKRTRRESDKKRPAKKSGTVKRGARVSSKGTLVIGTTKRYARRDAEGRFVESANEHLFRAWKSIHGNGSRERKAS